MKNKDEMIFTTSNKSKNIPNVFAVIFFCLTIFIIGGSIPAFINTEELAEYIQIGVFTLGLGFLIPLLYCLIYVSKVEKRRLSDIGLQKKDSLKLFIKGFFVGAILLSIGVALVVALGGYEITISDNISSSLLPTIIILMGFLIQGSTEEILIRGWMLSLLNSKYNLSFAVLISSIFFTFLHGLNNGITILSLINLFLFSIFAISYLLNEKSLWGICGFHVAWNWTQGCLFGVKVSGISLPGSFLVTTPKGSDFISGGRFGLEGSIVCSLIFIIAIIILLIAYKKKKFLK